MIRILPHPCKLRCRFQEQDAWRGRWPLQIRSNTEFILSSPKATVYLVIQTKLAGKCQTQNPHRKLFSGCDVPSMKKHRVPFLKTTYFDKKVVRWWRSYLLGRWSLPLPPTHNLRCRRSRTLIHTKTNCCSWSLRCGKWWKECISHLTKRRSNKRLVRIFSTVMSFVCKTTTKLFSSFLQVISLIRPQIAVPKPLQ